MLLPLLIYTLSCEENTSARASLAGYEEIEGCLKTKALNSRRNLLRVVSM
uniref:Uncharacterized protein n=1 Tax=Hyaloperonospora arabidopsidis (strain Emoy2) TaxID=559515 RepID=M4B4H9_HYAAE